MCYFKLAQTASPVSAEEHKKFYEVNKDRLELTLTPALRFPRWPSACWYFTAIWKSAQR